VRRRRSARCKIRGVRSNSIYGVAKRGADGPARRSSSVSQVCGTGPPPIHSLRAIAGRYRIAGAPRQSSTQGNFRAVGGRVSRIGRPLGTVADIVQGDGIARVGEQDAKNARAASIKHLPQGDANLLGFILGDGMPLRHLGQLVDRFFRARKPSGGSGGRTVRQEVELLHGLGPGSGGERNCQTPNIRPAVRADNQIRTYWLSECAL
jgi:hypothetical protein